MALADFLRKHRESLAPEHINHFPGSRPRRTPGLRRDEVAGIAGISTSWYASLEQGREDMAPSAAALERIAAALQLEPAERAYLFHIAGRVDPNFVSNFEDKLVVASIEDFVFSIQSPAYVLDKYWTPLLWNGASARIFGLWLEGPEKNLMRHMFLDPNARTFVVDWEKGARRLVAQFRIDFGRHPDDEKMLQLVRELSEGSDLFRSAWTDQQVRFRDGDEKSYAHPEFGLLTFLQMTFLVAAEPSLKLVVATERK